MLDDLSINIGEKIRERRKELGYNQLFLSERLGIFQNNISSIEKGKMGLTIERLIQLAEILKVDLNYFISQKHVDEKGLRILELEDLVKRLEKRNEILENYILKIVEP
jgi:transcriptional regulator with XRE-family HTH domain